MSKSKSKQSTPPEPVKGQPGDFHIWVGKGEKGEPVAECGYSPEVIEVEHGEHSFHEVVHADPTGNTCPACHKAGEELATNA
jgi:hypothetical protein